MSKPMFVLMTSVAVWCGTACNDATGPGRDTIVPPDNFELPQPDLSLDPSRLSVGDFIATPCAFGINGDRLEHLREQEEWALVDVYFGRSMPGEADGPTADESALVAAHGGRVLYRFSVPAVRARILLSRVPDLVLDGYWITVRDVPDPTRYDVRVSVGFDGPIRDSDVDLYGSLGGRIDHQWDFINGIAGALPDRSIAHLRGAPDVQYVEVSGIGCLD